MAKPWEKYSQPAPWERYAAPADFSGVTANVSSTEEVSSTPRDRFGNAPNDFARDASRDSSRAERLLAGAGKAFTDSARGLRQLAVDQISDPWGNSGIGVLGQLTGAYREPEALTQARQRGNMGELNQYAQQLRTEEAERRRLDPGLTDDPLFTAGNIGGTLLQLLGPGIALRGTTAGAALLPTTVRGNALQGALLGMVQPVAGEGERALNSTLGAAAGTAGTVLPNIAGRATNTIADLIAGRSLSGAERAAGRRIAESAGGDIMTPQPSAVRGVQRTLAEETGDKGIAALERMIRGREANTFGPQDAANNVARVRVLQGIAGTDADMAAAEAARSVAGRTAREEAMQAGPVDISLTVAQLDEAIAGQEGRPQIQAALQQVRNLLARDVEAAPGLTTTVPEDRINVLDNARLTIGDMLSGNWAADTNKALAGSRELIGIRDALNQEIGEQVPRFTDYLNAYRELSQPINRMEIGREMLSRTSAANAADTLGNPLLQPAKFGSAMKDMDAIAARATGFKKAKAEDILSPQDMQSLRAIADDMDRIAIAQRPTAANSTTDANRYLGDQLINEAAREAAKQLPFGLGALTYFQNKAAIETQEKMAYLLANPAEARRVISKLPPKDRAAVNKVLLQLSARPAAAAPALAQ